MPPRAVVAGILALALGWGGYLIWLARTDPRVVFLPSEPCGEWIVADEPVLLGSRHPGFYITHFRAAVPAGPARDAVLVLRALRIAEVSLDGRSVFASPRDVNVWKQERRVPLRLEWWQEPGYRVPAHLFSFGEALRYPIFGGVAGLWDAEYSTLWLDGWLSAVMEYDYRPPWNYALMLPAPWLAFAPGGAMLAGIATAPWRPGPSRRGVVLAAGLVAVYLVATLSLYLQVPLYAAAKATQLLGLTPCFAVLGAAGYEVLGRSAALRPLLYGATGCWALCAYLAYFVR